MKGGGRVSVEANTRFKLKNALLVDNIGEVAAGLVKVYGPVVTEQTPEGLVKKVRVYQNHKVTTPGSSNWVKFSKIYSKYGTNFVDSGL